MFTFFKHIGIGFISAITAFSGAFHSQPNPTPQLPPVAGTIVGTTTPNTIKVEKKNEAPKTTSIPTTDNSSVIQAQVQAILKAKADAQAALDAQAANDRQAQIEAANQKANADAQAKYNALLKQQTDAQAQATARQNSSECIQAKSAYDAIEGQIANTNALLRNALDAISGNGSITQSAQQGLKDNANATYSRTLADLAIKEQPLMSAYYASCTGNYSLPSQIQIPEQQHTNCSIYAGKITCDSYPTPY